MQASPIPNGFHGSADLPLPEQDLAEAKAAARPPPGCRRPHAASRVPGGQRLRRRLRHDDGKVQQDLDKVGVKLDLEPVEFARVGRADHCARASPSRPCTSPPTTPTRSQYVQYFGMITGLLVARAGGGDERADHQRAGGAVRAGAGRRRATPRPMLYTQLGQPMIDDTIIFPLVNPRPRAGQRQRHHRHALQRVLQPRARSARRLG